MHEHIFSQISGRLRDNQGVGVKQCEICALIVHEEDVTGQVNYQEGSMREWKQGHNLEGLTSEDIVRRTSALLPIVKVMGPNATLLDFGCGYGDMVLAMQEHVPDSFGYDIDFSRISSSLKPHRIFTSLNDFGHKKFAVITAFHLVEHVIDVPELLSLLNSLLIPGGYLVIETPSALDALISRYNLESFRNFSFWSHHPSLCTNQFLEEALEDLGMSIIESTTIQRYGLDNHLFWLLENQPGGHKEFAGMVDSATDIRYKRALTERGIGDTIWIVAKRPES